MSRKQIKYVIALLFTIAVVHFLIPQYDLTLHILFRLLYLIPIAYVALRTGRRGGVFASLIVTLVFLPHFFFPEATQEFTAGNTAAIILFNFTGFFLGYFRDVSERGYISQQKHQVNIAAEGEEHHVLFYMDNSPLSIGAAEWFGRFFDSRDMSFTLFWTYNEDMAEEFASQKLADEHVTQLRTDFESTLDRIREVLINGGISHDRISVKTVAIQKKARVSDKILEELKNGGYDLILMPKHEQTKAQEFLFGDTAVRLLRKASVPVLSVKGTQEESSQ